MTLFCALSYKEWMKTRRILGVCVLVFAAVLLYSFIEVRHDMRLESAENVWYSFIFQGMSVAPLFMWIPPLAGLSVAVSQFVPEMTNKRLKLTLHLPAGETHIMLDMLLYGVASLAILFVVFEVLLIGLMRIYLPWEIVSSMLIQHLPWLAAGIAAYGFASWICIEPQWKQRILNALIAISGLSILFITTLPESYIRFGWGMILIVIVSVFAPLLSCARFKNGIQ